MRPRTFELVRYRDLSGVSGTGVVAEGCVFTDGSVALRWRGNNPATAVWPDVESVLAVHGHQGATEVHWLEDEAAESGEAWSQPGGARAESGEAWAESAEGWAEPAGGWRESADGWRERGAGRGEPVAARGELGVELEHLFGDQHNVRPPSSLSDPSALPPSRARGWAEARHLR